MSEWGGFYEYDGVLIKRGRESILFPSWKKRYFSLEANSVLSYYRMRPYTANKKMGSFTLLPTSSIVSENGLYFSICNVRSEHCSDLVDVMLCALSESEKKAWMVTLNRIVVYGRCVNASLSICPKMASDSHRISPFIVLPCRRRNIVGTSFSSNEQFFITYGNRASDRTVSNIQLWNRSTWEVVAEHSFQRSNVVCALVAPHGEQVFVGCGNGDVHALSCTDNALVLMHSVATRLQLSSLPLTPKGDRLMIVGERFQVWDVSTKDILTPFGKLLQSSEELERRVCITADGTRAITIDVRGGLHVWGIRDGALCDRQGTIEREDVVSVVASPFNSSWVMSSMGGNTLQVWDVTTLKRVHDIELLRQPDSFCFSPDGRHVLALFLSVAERMIHVWDTATWERKAQYLDVPVTFEDVAINSINHLAVTPTSEHIVAAGDKFLVVWNGFGSHVVP